MSDEVRSEAGTQIPERWRLPAALVLLATGILALVVVISGAVSYADWFNTFHHDCQDVCFTPATLHAMQSLGISRAGMAAYWTAVNLVFFVTYAGVAALIYWRRAGDRMAWLGAFSLLTLGTAFESLPVVLSDVHPAWSLPIAIIGNENVLGFPSLILFFFLFPSGRFAPSWTRWVAFGFAGEYLVSALVPRLPISFITDTSPLGGFMPLLALSSLVVEQIYRYWSVSTPLERQQTKWIVFGSSVGLLCFVVLGYGVNIMSRLFFHGVSFSFLAALILVTVIYLALLLIPVSFAVAILRYRLWDVDVIINRALVYGLLSGALLLVWVGCIVGSQALLRALFNQTSNLAIVVSTLVVIGLFEPFRYALQQGIDRRFYRHKFDAERTLSAFAGTVGHDVDLKKICDDLMTVVQQTMQPEHVSLRLFQPGPHEEEQIGQVEPQAGGTRDRS
jgi:hypothetical protein